jgi:hypothetical protein
MTTAVDRASLARAGRARALAAAAFALPPLAVVALTFALALRGGGVVAEQWQLAAAALAAALLVLAAVGAVPSVPRAAWPLLASFAALLAWSAASLTWSESREATAQNVVRLLMLMAAAAVGAAYAARPRAALSLAAGLAVAGATSAALIEAKLLAGTTGAFAASRLSWPIDYANADAALVWLPLPPLVAFAAAERLGPPARALCGLFGALALAVGLTAESRGAAIALAGALVAAVVIARDRGRFTLTTAAVILPVGLAATALLDGDPSASASAARARGVTALIAAVAAAALVGGVAVLDRRGRWPFPGRQGRVAAALWAAVLVVGLVAFVVQAGRPDTWLQARWSEFRDVDPASTADASRFGTGTSNRYDYWRVAWRTFEDHPFQGVGSGAFGVPWLRSRSLDESVTDAHSWQASALAETGIVGLALWAAVLVLPLAAIRRTRRGPGARPLAAVALGGAAVYFVLHASIDWLFRIPALALPGFVVLGALASAGAAASVSLAGTRERAAVAAAALVAAAAILPAYLSVRKTNEAQAEAATSSAAALADLGTAARLNPFASEPLVLRAGILGSDGRADEAVRAAEEATRRAPNSSSAWLALADARRRAGQAERANSALERAAALNPRGARAAER